MPLGDREGIAWATRSGIEPCRLGLSLLGSGGEPVMSDLPEATQASETVDQQVLRLRGEGQPYARISRQLGLNRGADAQQAFVRALGQLPASDAQQVRADELTRLDRLAERVRGDAEQNDVDRARRLKTIERMRMQINQGS